MVLPPRHWLTAQELTKSKVQWGHPADKATPPCFSHCLISFLTWKSSVPGNPQPSVVLQQAVQLLHGPSPKTRTEHKNANWPL